MEEERFAVSIAVIIDAEVTGAADVKLAGKHETVKWV